MSTGLNDWNLDDAAEREAMLTAYALGELDDAATAAVDARLAEDETLRGELEAIRAVAGQLEAAFAADPAAGAGLGAERRATVDAGAATTIIEDRPAGEEPMPLPWVRRGLPLVLGGLAAAAVLGFSLVMVLPGPYESEVAIGTGADEARSDSAPGSSVIQPSGTPAPRERPRPEASSAVTSELNKQPFAMPRGGGDGGGGSGVAGQAADGRWLRDAPEPGGSRRDAPGSAAAMPPAGRLLERDRVAESRRQLYVQPGPPARDDRFAPEGSREDYAGLVDNDWSLAADAPLSTFSIDVDTASYANVRRFLESGNRPPKDAVRIEELINSFEYDYPVPAADADHPFSVTLESGPAPWADQHRLVRVGLKGHEMSMDERPAANLVFLLDCSGSMNQPNKLPLVKAGLKMLLRELGPSDRVALIVYAGRAGMVLDSTPVTDTGRAAIETAIDTLGAGGSTNGEGGIRLAYRVAAANMVPGGVNRVILCTDGDFNVGVSGADELQSLIERQRDTGVFLSVAGFGSGNYQDGAMERLSNHGNGTAAYIDSMREAEKVFVRNAVSSLVTIAKDVKIQVDFNPGQVQAYRLIGYANRMLEAEDFNDDRVDAGEIGAGHTVTALYEVIPVGVEMPRDVDASKYAQPAAADEADDAPVMIDSPEMLTVRVRYKQPDGDTSVRFDTPLVDEEAGLDGTSTDFRFAASVAGFGLLLRDSEHAGSLDWDMVRRLAEPGLADDPHGDRREFLSLVRAAEVTGD